MRLRHRNQDPEASASIESTPQPGRLKRLAKLALGNEQQTAGHRLVDQYTYDKAMEGVTKLEGAFRESDGPAGVIARKFDKLAEYRSAQLPANTTMDRKSIWDENGEALSATGTVFVTASEDPALEMWHPLVVGTKYVGADPFTTGGKITELSISEHVDFDTRDNSGSAQLRVRIKSRPEKDVNDPIGSAQRIETLLSVTPQPDGSFSYKREVQSSGYNRGWSGFQPVEVDTSKIEQLASVIDAIEIPQSA